MFLHHGGKAQHQHSHTHIPTGSPTQGDLAVVHQHPGAAGVSPNAPLPRQRGGSSGSRGRGNASPAKQRRGHGGRPTPALAVYIPAAPSQAAPARLRQLGWGWSWSARRHALEGGQEELPASAAPSNPLARVQRPRSKRRRAGGLTCRGKPLLAGRFVSSPPPTAQRQQPLSSPLRLLPRLTTVPGSPCRPRGSFPLRSRGLSSFSWQEMERGKRMRWDSGWCP